MSIFYLSLCFFLYPPVPTWRTPFPPLMEAGFSREHSAPISVHSQQLSQSGFLSLWSNTMTKSNSVNLTPIYTSASRSIIEGSPGHGLKQSGPPSRTHPPFSFLRPAKPKWELGCSLYAILSCALAGDRGSRASELLLPLVPTWGIASLKWGSPPVFRGPWSHPSGLVIPDEESRAIYKIEGVAHSGVSPTGGFPVVCARLGKRKGQVCKNATKSCICSSLSSVLPWPECCSFSAHLQAPHRGRLCQVVNNVPVQGRGAGAF